MWVTANSPLMALTASRQQSCKYQVNRSRLEQSEQTRGLITGGVEAPVLRRVQVPYLLVDDPRESVGRRGVSRAQQAGQLLLLLAW